MRGGTTAQRSVRGFLSGGPIRVVKCIACDILPSLARHVRHGYVCCDQGVSDPDKADEFEDEHLTDPACDVFKDRNSV